MITKKIYLLDPYNDVIKINAVGNCDFKLKLNGGIYYTKAELKAAIDAIPFESADEDIISKIARWISSDYSNQGNLRVSPEIANNILDGTNSFSDDICGGLGDKIFSLYSMWIDSADLQKTAGGNETVNHVWNGINHGLFDQISKVPKYKSKFVLATLDEIKADKFLYCEPIRSFDNYRAHDSLEDYHAYIDSEITPAYEEAGIVTTVDNLKMVLPSGSNMVFPVKTVNAPKTWTGANLTAYANAICTFPTGVIGIVQMPCDLINITGTGTVKIGLTTYTLPADATSIANKLADGAYYNSFEILTNTNGIVCEYLVNRKRWLLFKDNIIEYEMTTGTLTFERVKTAIPLSTVVVSIDKGSALSWTMNFDRYFTKSRSFKYPQQTAIWDAKIITFTNNAESKHPLPQIIFNQTPNDNATVRAGISVIDKAWSSKLFPREDTFTGSLELSFTSIDGESVYYTIDGTTPDTTKTLYTAPFTISATTTIKWICVKTGYANSHVNSRVITKTA